MSEAWKKLLRTNRKGDEAREREGRFNNLTFLYIFPALPALLFLTFSDESIVDVVGQVAFLGSLRDYVGPNIVAYTVTVAYLLLIGLLQLGFYRELSMLTRVAIAWVAWVWFYVSTWVLNDLKLAFIVLLVVSLFMIRIVAWLTWCYERIRDGMFLSGGGDT